MNQHDIESDSLPAHVSICQERYQRLADRLEAMDQRMDRIEHSLAEIKTCLDTVKNQHYNQWDRLRDVTIGVLVAAVGYLAARLLM